MALTFLNKLTNLQQRFVIGLPGAAAIVFLICYSEWTYFFLFFTICFFVLKEFYNLIQQAGIKPNKVFGIASGMLIFTLLYFLEKKVLPINYYYLLFPFIFLIFIIGFINKSFPTLAARF